ncbi:DUF58 domain-containing protein [Shewanella yunxiaonensis]|uniref:DUF58 domain-containing protein n=1 Tax=Shewanella yunxiaonensis TaxID=2829809 RepID=A0ABX7YYW1_9GAMM|nr:DUF58 domain-containing protein [Shewanella yunxiaonensis]QUN07613.1 DUF58 domain-containing protein [Shewanella yunxiaonensis]
MQTPPNTLPLFADGVHLSEAELLACRNLARAIPDRRVRARAAMAGNRSSLIKGRGMEFAEVRHYQHGDDVRTIDWRVTARTGKAHTKLFVEERERPVLLLVDLKHSLYFGSTLLLQSVQVAHLAATLGWNAIQQGDRLGALIVGDNKRRELKPRTREHGILALISAMTEVHKHQLEHLETPVSASQGLMAQSCRQLVRLTKPGSQVWLITDGNGFDDDCRQSLSALTRHNEVAAFVVTDPLRNGTLQLPKRFSLPVRDQGKSLVLDRHSYDAWLERQRHSLWHFEQMMQSLSIPVRLIDAGQNLNQQMNLLR